jgi:hypothetical protein
MLIPAVLIVLLINPSIRSFAQSRATARPAADSGDFNTGFEKAFKTGKLVQTSPTELKLDKTIALDGGERSSTLKPDEVLIQFEVGQQAAKHVFVDVAVPQDQTKSATPMVESALRVAKPPTFEQFVMCAADRQCGKTCIDKDGKEYCCKWICKS